MAHQCSLALSAFIWPLRPHTTIFVVCFRPTHPFCKSVLSLLSRVLCSSSGSLPKDNYVWFFFPFFFFFPDFQPFFLDFSRQVVYYISLFPERFGLPMICVKITSPRAHLGLKAVNYKISLFTDMSGRCNCLNISSLSKTNKKNGNNTTYVLKHAFFLHFIQ